MQNDQSKNGHPVSVGSTGCSGVYCTNCANLCQSRFITTPYGWGGYTTLPYWVCAFDGPDEEAQCPHYKRGDNFGTCEHGISKGLPTDECFCVAARSTPIHEGAIANGYGYRQRLSSPNKTALPRAGRESQPTDKTQSNL